MEPEKLLEALHTAEKLKDTTRHCYTSKGRHESVAEHSWRIALMAFWLRDEFPQADMDKVIRMCLIHDLGECFTGDIPAFDKTAADEAAEEALLSRWVDSLPEPVCTEMRTLYAEMAALQTTEAKIYKALDKMEAIVQHNESAIATWVSVLVYGAVSCWMYVIGMGAAIFTGEYDIAVIMVKAGLGIAALIILVFSTVTTTFLDAWSAGISAESLSAKLNGKKTAIAVTVIGTAAAILFPMDDITGFLYLIGSVFAPMIAVQIADHFILHRDRFAVAADARNLVIWLVGFIAYRLLMGVDTPVGYTLPDMVLTVVLCLLAEKVKPTKQM